ncbi:MAG: DUF1638 domain-containing protein [Clostridiaceae bacterium]
MRYKLISCEVFSRPAFKAAANSRHTVDMEFTKLRSHTKPESLREEIQSIIDRTTEQYDAILLCYGLCGNGTAGLVSRSLPMVIPRAHDCCTIFLGSRSAFLEHFGKTPSAQWSTACYFERSDGWYSDNAMNALTPEQDNSYAELVLKYGEENAQYIWETMNVSSIYDFLTYIDLPGIADNNARGEFIKHAAEKGKKTRFLEGSTRLIDKLLTGDWNDEEFLVIPPGHEIKPVYDHDRIMEV